MYIDEIRINIFLMLSFFSFFSFFSSPTYTALIYGCLSIAMAFAYTQFPGNAMMVSIRTERGTVRRQWHANCQCEMLNYDAK